MSNLNPTETKSRPAAWWTWLVPLLCLMGLVAVFFFVRGQRLPNMSQEAYDAAYAKWRENGPTDYEVTIVVKGRQPGEYVVRVKDGVAVEAKMNDYALTQPRTYGTWSVEGLFETLHRDLATNEVANNLLLGALFDEQWGLPRRYERLEMQTGNHAALQWEVTRFQSMSIDEMAMDQ